MTPTPELTGWATRWIPARAHAALAVCRSSASLRRTSLIALCVGTVLSTINQGDVILAGGLDAATAVKLAFNYVVPFMSSNLGVIVSIRLGRLATDGSPDPNRHHPTPSETARHGSLRPMQGTTCSDSPPMADRA